LPCGGPLDTPFVAGRRVGDRRAGLSIMVGVTGIGAGVRCHLLDDRGMIVNERSVRGVVDETRKFAGNGITRQQDARFKWLNLEAALPLALVTAGRRAMPTPDGQPTHKLPPHTSVVIVVDQHLPECPHNFAADRATKIPWRRYSMRERGQAADGLISGHSEPCSIQKRLHPAVTFGAPRIGSPANSCASSSIRLLCALAASWAPPRHRPSPSAAAGGPLASSEGKSPRPTRRPVASPSTTKDRPANPRRCRPG